VIAAAWAEYDKVIAAAFVEAWFSKENK
jgi:hypothetical protein